MSSSSKEGVDILFEDAVTYAREHVYRNGDNLTANQKRVIRKKAAKLVLEDGEVFMRKKGKVSIYAILVESKPIDKI